MKIPIYNIEVNLDDDATGMTAISFVEDPAIESNFLYFNKETKPMVFKVEDKMQHKVTGCAIWADKPIYRYSPSIGEYYTVFTPETIDRIVHKYAKQGLNNLVDLQHNGKMIDGVVMVEYFIKDTNKGIDPKGFEEIADGSLFVTYKIEDDELWNEIINPESEFKGFSIEINADIVPTGEFVEKEPEDDFDAFLSELVKALEGLDCEIIMESDKDKWLVNGDGEYWLDENGNKVPAKCPKCGADVGVYIKGEPVFLCSECGEYLGTVKFPDDEMFSVDIKKKSEQLIIEDEKDDDGENDGHWGLNYLFAVERSDIAKNVKKSALINGKEYWIYGIGKRSGNDIAIAYDPEKRRYNIIPLEDIKEFEPTKTATGTFPALPESIVEDDEITVQKTIVSDDIPSILHNRTMAIINYNDEKPNPHTNARQIAIVAYGLTKAGNLAIRAYERFGDSRSAAEGEGVIPDYRMFLVKRIQSIKPMTGTQPWGRDLLDSRYNWLGDKGLPTLYEHITESDFN